MGNCTEGRKCGFGSDEEDGASSPENYRGPNSPGKDDAVISSNMDGHAATATARAMTHSSIVLDVLPSLNNAQSSCSSLHSAESTSDADQWRDDFMDDEGSEEEDSGSDWCATDDEESLSQSTKKKAKSFRKSRRRKSLRQLHSEVALPEQIPAAADDSSSTVLQKVDAEHNDSEYESSEDEMAGVRHQRSFKEYDEDAQVQYLMKEIKRVERAASKAISILDGGASSEKEVGYFDLEALRKQWRVILSCTRIAKNSNLGKSYEAYVEMQLGIAYFHTATPRSLGLAVRHHSRALRIYTSRDHLSRYDAAHSFLLHHFLMRLYLDMDARGTRNLQKCQKTVTSCETLLEKIKSRDDLVGYFSPGDIDIEAVEERIVKYKKICNTLLRIRTNEKK